MAMILKRPTSDAYSMWKGQKALEYCRNLSSRMAFEQRAVPWWRNGQTGGKSRSLLLPLFWFTA